MSRKHLRIQANEPCRRLLRRGSFRVWGAVIRSRFEKFKVFIFDGGPVQFLKIKITETVYFFWILRANGEECRRGGERRSGSGEWFRSENGAKSFDLRRGQDGVGGDGEVIEMPLRNTGGSLIGLE